MVATRDAGATVFPDDASTPACANVSGIRLGDLERNSQLRAAESCHRDLDERTRHCVINISHPAVDLSGRLRRRSREVPGAPIDGDVGRSESLHAIVPRASPTMMSKAVCHCREIATRGVASIPRWTIHDRSPFDFTRRWVRCGRCNPIGRSLGVGRWALGVVGSWELGIGN
jgi:hypothetical protein